MTLLFYNFLPVAVEVKVPQAIEFVKAFTQNKKTFIINSTEAVIYGNKYHFTNQRSV